MRSRWTEIRRSIGQWWTPLLYFFFFMTGWSSLCWQVLILNSSMFPSFTIHFVRMFTTSNFKFTLINTIQHHLSLTTPTYNWDSVGILLSSIYLHHQQYTVYLIPHQKPRGWNLGSCRHRRVFLVSMGWGWGLVTGGGRIPWSSYKDLVSYIVTSSCASSYFVY